MVKTLVLPGEPICKEEEYMAYKNVYIDVHGTVRAAVVGEVVYDNINRRISVKPIREVKIPKSGDVAIGVVMFMRDDIASIEVVGYDLTKMFKHSYTAYLHILQATDVRGDNLYSYVRLGDIVKVKILNNYIPLLVTIKEPRLGVILAFCSRCGSQLYRENDRLICPVCNNIETRKISLDYMLTRGRRGAKA